MALNLQYNSFQKKIAFQYLNGCIVTHTLCIEDINHQLRPKCIEHVAITQAEATDLCDGERHEDADWRLH